MTYYNIYPTLTITLAEETINDIMCCALDFEQEYGIRKWCDYVDVPNQKKGLPIWKQLSAGSSLHFFPADTDLPEATLSLHDLLAGIKLALERGLFLDRLLDDGSFDTEGLSAFEADMLVQYSLFGMLQFE